MKERHLSILGAISALAFLCSSRLAIGQATSTPATSAASSTASPQLLQFQQTQQALAQQLQQLQAQGATPDQINSWLAQNKSTIQAQQQLAKQLGDQSAAQPLPTVGQVTIPAGASQDEADFLTEQASLANLRAQIHNQLLQQGTVSAEQENDLFQQQAGSALQEQAQRAQRIAAANAAQPLPDPPPLNIPPNASANLQAFLKLRDQLMREEIALHNQNLQANPTARAAALQQWRQSRAAQFQQLQQLAQAVSQEHNQGN